MNVLVNTNIKISTIYNKNILKKQVNEFIEKFKINKNIFCRHFSLTLWQVKLK